MCLSTSINFYGGFRQISAHCENTPEFELQDIKIYFYGGLRQSQLIVKTHLGLNYKTLRFIFMEH
jgi:hypothetical protein